jgi:hypothetical protein
MFKELTRDLLDLTATTKGGLGSYFALLQDCCSCCCCWTS